MKKLTIIMLIALLIPATTVLGQMRWQDQGGDRDFMFFQGKGPGFDGPRMGQGMRGHGQGPHGIMGMADELGLTDDQKDRLQKMALENQLDMVDKRAAVKKAQIGLKALMLDDADEGKVFAAIDKVTGLKAEIQKARFRHHQQVKALLTDEQVKKLKECRFDSKEFHFMGKPGRRGGMQRRVIEIEVDDD